jgi:hypothetical protein
LSSNFRISIPNSPLQEKGPNYIYNPLSRFKGSLTRETDGSKKLLTLFCQSLLICWALRSISLRWNLKQLCPLLRKYCTFSPHQGQIRYLVSAFAGGFVFVLAISTFFPSHPNPLHRNKVNLQSFGIVICASIRVFSRLSTSININLFDLRGYPLRPPKARQ